MAKTKSSLGGTIGLIALIAFAGIMISVKGKPEVNTRIPADEDITEQVLLTVTFDPGHRQGLPVDIQAHVEGVRVENLRLERSPFNKIITIPKGAQVSLYAGQSMDGSLDCLIVAREKTMDHQHRDSMGSVRCWYNRKG